MLPSFLLAYCGDPAFWIYSDQKCDGTNNCGDCSDELSPGVCVGGVWAQVGRDRQSGSGQGYRLRRRVQGPRKRKSHSRLNTSG